MIPRWLNSFCSDCVSEVVLTLLQSTKPGRAQLYTVFCYWCVETYLGWGFLVLIGVDRDGQNWGRAALSFGPTGPVTALLTLGQGVICAGTAAIIHPHRPVTPYKHPCWCKQREASPLTAALKETLRRSCVKKAVTFPDLQPLTCVHHVSATALN